MWFDFDQEARAERDISLAHPAARLCRVHPFLEARLHAPGVTPHKSEADAKMRDVDAGCDNVVGARRMYASLRSEFQW